MKNKLIVGISFIILTLIITFPSIFFLTTKVIGDGGDGFQFMGFQYIAKMLFSHGQFPFGWTNYWRYPYGVEFQNISDSSLFTLLGLLFYSFLTNPILIYNLSVLFLIFLNLGLSYIVFRTYFTRILSFTGTIIYGLSFFTISKLGGHVNLILTAAFPFFFYSVYKIYKNNGSLQSFIIFSFASLLLIFSSLQFPLFLLGGLPFIMILLYVFYPQELKSFAGVIWNKKKYTLISIVIIFMFFFLLHGNKLIAYLQGNVQLPVNEITTVPPENLFLPNQYLHTVSSVITNDSKEWIEYSLFLGYIEIILLAGALVFTKENKLKSFFVYFTLIFLIISLGKQPILSWLWPYQYLFHILPYRGIIEPGRFFMLFYLGITFLILLLLQKITNKYVLLAIALLLIVERLPVGFRLTDESINQALVSKVQQSPTRAVLDLPIYTDWWNGQLYDYYSIYYQKPIVNGYFHWSGNTPVAKSLVNQMGEYTCYYDPNAALQQYDQNLAQYKKKQILNIMNIYQIKTLIIHKNLYLNSEHCGQAKNYIQTLIEDQNQWQKLYEDTNSLVLWLK